MLRNKLKQGRRVGSAGVAVTAGVAILKKVLRGGFT